MSRFRNRAGMTLIEILAVVAVSSIILLGMMSMFKTTSSMVQDIGARSGIGALQSALIDTISTKANCTAAMGGVQPTFTAPTTVDGDVQLSLKIGDPTSAPIAAGADLPAYNLKIASTPQGFHLNIPVGSTPTPSPGINTWTGSIEVTPIKRGSEAAGGTTMQKRVIGGMSVDVDTTTNQVVSCTGSIMNSAVCTAMGGAWNTVSATCTLPFTYPCPSGTILTGPNPATDCVPVGAVSGGQCPPGQMLTGTNPATDCKPMAAVFGGLCPAGQFLTGTNPATDCKPIGSMIGALCPANFAALSDGAGSFTCVNWGSAPTSPPTTTNAPVTTTTYVPSYGYTGTYDGLSPYRTSPTNDPEPPINCPTATPCTSANIGQLCYGGDGGNQIDTADGFAMMWTWRMCAYQ